MYSAKQVHKINLKNSSKKASANFLFPICIYLSIYISTYLYIHPPLHPANYLLLPFLRSQSFLSSHLYF